jgi:hypothetical protein
MGRGLTVRLATSGCPFRVGSRYPSGDACPFSLSGAGCRVPSPIPMAAQQKGWGCLVAILAVIGALLLFAPRTTPTIATSHSAIASVVSTRPSVDRPPRHEPRCLLSIPGEPDLVPVFPTKAGFDEYGRAAADHDEKAMTVAALADGMFLQLKGSRCAWLDVGIATTKIRVTEGDHVGLTGYVPTEWAQGKE